MNEFCELLDLSASSESRLEKRPWALLPIVESVANGFRWYVKENDIDLTYDAIDEDLRVPYMYKSELSSILHNLMTNAFKAVQGERDRRVEIRGIEDGLNTHILMLDSGKGLNQELWEEVFEPFISYS